jgi:hypothetical protein
MHADPRRRRESGAAELASIAGVHNRIFRADASLRTIAARVERKRRLARTHALKHVADARVEAAETARAQAECLRGEFRISEREEPA